MAGGSKEKYTSKQKRKAHDIEKGYKKRGVSSKEAERRAWATVNKTDKGARKTGGGGRGKSEVNQVLAKVEGRAVESRAAESIRRLRAGGGCHDSSSDVSDVSKRSLNFISIWSVSFGQPWLLVCPEQRASFWTDAQ